MKQQNSIHVTPQRKGYITHDKYIFLVHKRRLMEDVKSLRKLNFTFSF